LILEETKFGQMVQKIKISDMNYPYKKYEKTFLWNVLKKAIDELKENQDIEITTKEEYVIGFLCKKISTDKKGLAKIQMEMGNGDGKIKKEIL
jgi:hypothetical protein